jgi:hypothetical protein
MGRFYSNRKATAEESYRLRMSYLKKLGMLTEKENIQEIIWKSSKTQKSIIMIIGVFITNDNPSIVLMYTISDREGNKADYKDTIRLLTTECYFGGIRYWFGCPSCGQRVGVLYLAPGNIYFRCRHCNNLSYQSRNRCIMETCGHTSRQIEKLRSQIKRWTWRGRPTRKVRKLNVLERKESALLSAASAATDTLLNNIKCNNP